VLVETPVSETAVRLWRGGRTFTVCWHGVLSFL